MKKLLCLLMTTILLCSFSACASDNSVPLSSGIYLAVGDYEEGLTPYVRLDTDNSEFSFGPGLLVSYAEHGTYEIDEGKVIAASQNTSFQFDVLDKNTLVLIDNGDSYSEIPVNTQFVFCEAYE